MGVEEYTEIVHVLPHGHEVSTTTQEFQCYKFHKPTQFVNHNTHRLHFFLTVHHPLPFSLQILQDQWLLILTHHGFDQISQPF